jgi:hypothetical protein
MYEAQTPPNPDEELPKEDGKKEDAPVEGEVVDDKKENTK